MDLRDVLGKVDCEDIVYDTVFRDIDFLAFAPYLLAVQIVHFGCYLIVFESLVVVIVNGNRVFQIIELCVKRFQCVLGMV